MFVRGYELRRRILVARTRLRFRHDTHKQDEAIADVEKWLAQRLERHRGEHKLSVGLLEASLLITGTVLWGFGDLIRFVL